MERKIKEIVTYEDRTFVIKKMTPFEGIAVLKEILTKALPIDFLSFLNDSGAGIDKILSMTNSVSKKEMSIDEFVVFQKRLMKNVYEKLKSGDVPVIQENGDFGVLDMEENMFLVGFLLLKVIEVNYKDFFLEILQKLGLLEDAQKMMNEMKEKKQEGMAQETQAMNYC